VLAYNVHQKHAAQFAAMKRAKQPKRGKLH